MLFNDNTDVIQQSYWRFSKCIDINILLMLFSTYIMKILHIYIDTQLHLRDLINYSNHKYWYYSTVVLMLFNSSVDVT